MKKAFDEELVEFLQNKISKVYAEESKYYNDEYSGNICDDLLEALDLCEKLLTNDYFKKSESIIEKFNFDSPKGYSKMCNSWGVKYKKDLKEKKKDLSKLFKIIVNNCEDWC